MLTRAGCVLAVALMPIAASAQVPLESGPSDDGLALGAGVGFPSDVLTFGVVSAKARIARVQIEPFFRLTSTASGERYSARAATTTTSSKEDDSGMQVGLGSNVYYPIAVRSNLELQVLGSLSVTRNSSTNDPDGGNNNTERTSMTFGVGYGLAIEWWFFERFSLSARATNTLVSRTSSTVEQRTGPDSSAKTETTSHSIGLVWSPSVAAVLNMWF